MNHRFKPGGERAATIDEIPLDWCFRPGVKLDFRRFESGYVATAADVETELKRIGYELKELDIVLVNTAAGERYGQLEYWETGCGMGREATLWLTERGIRVVGIDAFGWDAPFSYTASGTRRRRIHPSSGRAIRRAGKSATAKWKSCTTSRFCRRRDSQSLVFP